MADNIQVSQGTGTAVATDYIDGAHYQRIKNGFGTDGNFADVSTSNPLPVVQTGALPAGSNLVGDVQIRPSTSNGLDIYRNLDTGSTGVNIKSSAGKVYGWYLFNQSSAVRFVKLYNKASAPTVGTDVPVLTIALPAGGGANVEFGMGLTFGTGIGIGATTGIADNNTGAPSANDVIVNIFYK